MRAIVFRRIAPSNPIHRYDASRVDAVPRLKEMTP